jgi:thymidylate kinase
MDLQTYRDPSRDGRGETIQEWKDPAVHALMTSLDGREYCVLHGWQSLHEGPTSDVDIVVAERDLSALERALRRDCGVKIAQVIRYEGGCGFFFVAVRESDGEPEFTQIDAATGYSRDGRILLDSCELLEGRWKYNGMWVVRPESEFAYLLIKKICKRNFPMHQKERLAELREALGDTAVRIAEDVLGHESAPDVVDSIVESNWSALESRLDELHRRLLRRASHRHRWNAVRYWMAEVRRGIWRWRNPTGLMLAILGPDGSGKSTLIESLESKARPLFWRKAALFHFRPDVLGTTKNRGPVLQPHLQPPRNALSSVLKLAYYAADFCAGYLKTIRPGLIRSRLMIFDRYYHDILVDQRRYRYSGPMRLARLVASLIPQPDMFLIVDASEETIRKRKQELPLEELRCQRIAYRHLAATLPNAILLDGSTTPAEVARQACRHIIDKMAGRYQHRRKTWFRDDRVETLQWLSLALSQEDDGYISISPTRTRERDSFLWFRLADGRSYLLPADSSSAARAGLDLYRPQRLKSLVAKAALGATLKTGTARLFLSEVRAADHGSGGLAHGIFDHLRGLVDTPLRCAVSLGTPGPHCKPVIQLMHDDGRPFAFAKVGWNDETNELIRNEAETYRRLSRLKFVSFEHPEIVHADRWGAHFVTIQSGPGSGITASSPSSVEPYVRAVSELSEGRTVRMRLRESEFGRSLAKQMETGTGGNHGWMICESIRVALALIGDRQLPFHPAHGDLAPWNACMAANSLYLFDWEYSRWNSPAGWDLFHFYVQTRSRLARRSPIEIIEGFARFAESVKSYLRRVDLDDDLLKPLFLLYIAERLMPCAQHREHNLDELRLLSSIAGVLTLQCEQPVRPESFSGTDTEKRP